MIHYRLYRAYLPQTSYQAIQKTKSNKTTKRKVFPAPIGHLATETTQKQKGHTFLEATVKLDVQKDHYQVNCLDMEGGATLKPLECIHKSSLPQ